MNSIDIWNDLGNLYLKANSLDAAIDAYNKAIRQGYQTAEIYKNLGRAYLSHGNIAESITLYHKSVELLSDNKEKALVLTLLGDSYRRVADFDNAIASFKKAIDMEPGNPSLCVGLGAVQKDLEKLYGFDTSDGSEIMEVSQIGINGNASESMANNQDQADLPDALPEDALNPIPLTWMPVMDSEGDLKDSLSIQFDGNEILNDMADSEPKRNGFIGEMVCLDEELFPGSNVVTLMSKSESSDSISGMHEIQINGEVPFGGHFIPGLTGDEVTDQTDEIGQNINGDTDLEKENGVQATLLLTLGIMHWRNGSLDEAEITLQSAINYSIKINNNWFEALSWHAIALVKTALGDISAAIQAYLKAVELAPEQIFPWNNLGSLYGSMGCHDKALESFQKAIRQNPEDSDSWDGLGDIYTKLGRMDDAISAYQLGNVFEKNAQGGDAIKAYEKALDFYQLTISSFENEIRTTQENINYPASQPGSGLSSSMDEVGESFSPEPISDYDFEDSNMVSIGEIGAINESSVESVPASTLSVDVPEISQDSGDQGSDIGISDEKIATLAGLVNQQNNRIDAADEIVQDVRLVYNDNSRSENSDNLVMVSSVNPDLLTPDAESIIEPAKLLVETPVVCVTDLGENDMPVLMLDPISDKSQEILAETGSEVGETRSESNVQSVPGAGEASILEIMSPIQITETEQIAINEPGLSSNAGSSSAPIASIETNLMSTGVDQPQVVAQVELDEKKILVEKIESNKDEILTPVVTIVNPQKTIQSPERIAGTIASYEAVVRQNPQNDRAWDSLGNLYRISQRNGEAIHAYERAVSLEPNKYIYHYQLGALYAAEGNFKDAIGELLQVVELNPNFIFAHCALASYLRKIGKEAEAHDHIAIALPHMATEKEYDRACFESIRGNVDKALELLTIALGKQQTTIEWIRRDLDLDFIRQDPRYEQFEARFSQSVINY